MKKVQSQNEFIDHILEFDPEDVSTAASFSSLQPEFLLPRNLVTPLSWPDGLMPVPQPVNNPNPNSKLPVCDYLVVTWTVAEALALSDILTPGYRSKTDWYNYSHLFNSHYKPIIKKGAPSLNSNRLGTWFKTKIGNNTLMCFKSDLHLARDGSKLPVKDLWHQLITEVNPKVVITTGTAGAIGKDVILGDVVVSKKLRFLCNKTFKKMPFNNKEYINNNPIKSNRFKYVNENFLNLNANKLPVSNRTPLIISTTSAQIKYTDVVTTDFFAYDNTIDIFHLQSLGAAVEMGDAVLGLVCDELGPNAPDWYTIRNASDPQIDGTLTPKEQIQMAARIYEKYGYWTTVESAFACWAVIAP